MHIKFLLLLITIPLLHACSSSKKASQKTKLDEKHNAFMLTEVSTDSTYGYTETNPIKVGGVKSSSGPMNERRFLNGLNGPDGEELSYERTGSCCPFKTKNGIMGGGLLDRYAITWEGQTEPVYIYINMYDAGDLYVPVGLTAKIAK